MTVITHWIGSASPSTPTASASSPGAPHDGFPRTPLAGSVYWFRATGARTFRTTRITQNSPGVPGNAEYTDHFGTTVALRAGRLAVGIPGESIGSTGDRGQVQRFRLSEATGTYTSLGILDQNTPGIPGVAESGDRFGSSLAIGRNLLGAGSYDLAVGSDGESLGGKKAEGTVTVMTWEGGRALTFGQNDANVPDRAESGDMFGSALGVMLPSGREAGRLLVGAPREDASATAGVIDSGYLITSPAGFLTARTAWQQLPAPATTRYGRWGGVIADV